MHTVPRHNTDRATQFIQALVPYAVQKSIWSLLVFGGSATNANLHQMPKRSMCQMLRLLRGLHISQSRQLQFL